MSYLTRGNVALNGNRSANVYQNILTQPAYSAFDPNTITPVPIDLIYTLTFITKYPDDMDMLISNLVPFFHRDVYVTSPHPKLQGSVINHQIIWDGVFDTKWPAELQNNENDIQICSTSFTFRTELFGGSGYIPPNSNGEIHTINLTLSPSTPGLTGTYIPSGNNILGGFFPVPYAQSFADYTDTILTATSSAYYVDPIRDEFLFNVYNEQFNQGVLSDNLSAVQSAVLSGANIYTTSYWPLTYAQDNHFTDIVTYIESLSGYIHR